MGRMYEEGIGIEQNSRWAFHWYEKAAKQKHAKALYNLGMMYQKGKGTTYNPRRAIELFTSAAKQGYHPAAQNAPPKNAPPQLTSICENQFTED